MHKVTVKRRNLYPLSSITANLIADAGPLTDALVGKGIHSDTPSSISIKPQPAGDGGSNGGGRTPTPTNSPPWIASQFGLDFITPSPPPTSPAIGTSPSTITTPLNPNGGGNYPPPDNNGPPGPVGGVTPSQSPGPSSSVGGGGNYMTTSISGLPVPIDVSTTSMALGMSSATPATDFLFSSQSPLGSSSAVVSLSTTSAAAATSSGKRLSGGAITGITITCLFTLLTIALLIVRRRSIARRMELRRQWWFSRNGSGRSFLFINKPVGSNGSSSNGTSARSSFATNFDHGLIFGINPHSPTIIPELPPLAEVRERNSVLISTGAAVARRESMNNMLSAGTDADVDSSMVQNKMKPSTPMFVSPFSPSESFPFPKPPVPPSSAADSDSLIIYATQARTSSHSSATTLVEVRTPPRAFMIDLPPMSVSTPAFYPQTSIPTVTGPSESFIAAPPNPSVNPFNSPVTPEFAEVEIVRRPFEPSLHDELAVHSGDRVRILKIFDDGWTFVDKLAGTEEGHLERGLIPVDCLREAGQTLPTFFTQKRVNGYGSDQQTGTAL